MLTRIVRMTFNEKHIEDFLEMFAENREKIGGFPGCQQLILMKDADKSDVYITYSIWDSKEALETYRHSVLFKGVWAKTKQWFADKPFAFSAEEVKLF
ncbi:putative quinol monooxygenase [Chondrinema litorale]|uniref:putative quinol monooxygenase n=1 Tax=Chondrinema litorale TaxID=2994555 RepID=UPI002543C198|nr:antibiotic biosynthesis monooxygenase family protein [Chondrinema litorale]UZR95179.1 antibiotic biosynthesis monooxygenase [Chondrinema litorale]